MAKWPICRANGTRSHMHTPDIRKHFFHFSFFMLFICISCSFTNFHFNLILDFFSPRSAVFVSLDICSLRVQQRQQCYRFYHNQKGIILFLYIKIQLKAHTFIDMVRFFFFFSYWHYYYCVPYLENATRPRHSRATNIHFVYILLHQTPPFT